MRCSKRSEGAREERGSAGATERLLRRGGGGEEVAAADAAGGDAPWSEMACARSPQAQSSVRCCAQGADDELNSSEKAGRTTV